jgi:hypothetical protein
MSKAMPVDHEARRESIRRGLAEARLLREAGAPLDVTDVPFAGDDEADGAFPEASIVADLATPGGGCACPPAEEICDACGGPNCACEAADSPTEAHD